MSKEILINLILNASKNQMSEKEYGYIADIIHSKNGCNLLVFGVGLDSKLWLWANQKGKTIFLEDSSHWINNVKSDLPGNLVEKVTYSNSLKDWKNLYLEGDQAHKFELTEEITNTKWDVILVDGPKGYAINDPGRMISIFTASKLGRKNIGTEIFIHDIDRIAELAYCKRYFGKDELVSSFDRLAHYKTKREKPLRFFFATTHHYPPQRVGGSESSTHDLCTLLMSSGYSCAVLANLLPEGELWSSNRFMAQKSGLQFPPDFEMGYPVFRGLNPIDGVYEIAENLKPDVAIIQAGMTVPLAKAFLENNIPTIIYIRDVEFHEHGGNYSNFPGINYFANSHFAAKRFYEKFNITAIPIAPLINPDKYYTYSTRRNILYVCPHPYKGAEIAFQLAESNPNLQFIFVESWTLNSDLREKYISRAKKSGNIEWYSRQKDMKQFYSRAKLVIMPSIWEECWGRIITEAQISGIPALASDIGGLPESVADAGVLINPKADISIWSNALNKIMNDNNFYEILSQNALKASSRKILRKDYILDQFIRNISHFLLEDTLRYQNIRRNQICPCGLSRKFKHCHGKTV